LVCGYNKNRRVLLRCEPHREFGLVESGGEKAGGQMQLIVHLGIIALLAAIGSSLGQQFYGEQGVKFGALVGGVLGLLVILVLWAGTSNR